MPQGRSRPCSKRGKLQVRAQLTAIEVSSLNRTAIFDHESNVLPGELEALNQENEVQIARVAWLIPKERSVQGTGTWLHGGVTHQDQRCRETPKGTPLSRGRRISNVLVVKSGRLRSANQLDGVDAVASRELKDFSSCWVETKAGGRPSLACTMDASARKGLVEYGI